MSDPPVDACEVCGVGSVEKVLYPVAVHFKGSGFYTTDYGRRGRRRDDSPDGDKPAGDAKPEKSEGVGEKKPAET
jgi:predicted nucleic acid-binding Zn ribbon protein